MNMSDWSCFLFRIKFVGFCQSTNWQRASHTVSKERWGLSRYGLMPGCVKTVLVKDCFFFFQIELFRESILLQCHTLFLCVHSNALAAN